MKEESNENKEHPNRPEYYHEEQWKFKDGIRTVDFILVWGDSNRKMSMFKVSKASAAEERRVFENNLKDEGLELEEDFVEGTGLHFIKVHAPMKILKRYAEILKLRMPIKNLYKRVLDNPEHDSDFPEVFVLPKKLIGKRFDKWFSIKPDIFPDYSEEYTTTYTRAKDFLFDTESPLFMIPAQKARIVQFILDRTPYSQMASDHGDAFQFGINRLVLHGTYVAAYPLHDGDWNTEGTMRCRLYRYWAAYKNVLKYQPADVIMQYFGVKVALYFVWLGHYVRMLIPASIVGLLCVIISSVMIYSSHTVYVRKLKN